MNRMRGGREKQITVEINGRFPTYCKQIRPLLPLSFILYFRIQQQPSDYHSGKRFSEGRYSIAFLAVDSASAAATCVMEFEVKGNLLSSQSLRKHAYSNILKILPPKTENFQIKILTFFLFLLKT